MGAINTPDTLGTMLQDLDRRIRVLENTNRTGLGRMRAAWLTAAADATTFGSFESGPVGATYSYIKDDLTTGTGTGYPALTVTTGAFVQITWACRPLSVSAGGSFRSASAQFDVLVDGLSLNLPRPLRQYANGNNNPVDGPLSCQIVRTLTPGTHTFQLVVNWSNDFPAATAPRLTDGFLSVLPLSAA